MSVKPEEVYLRSMKKLIKATYQLKNYYIDEPTFDSDGELIIVPREKFRSHVTQALMLTRHYKFIESQNDGAIYIRFSNLRDSDFNQDTQYERIMDLIQLLDAIVSQIESGILYFSAGTLSVTAQGSLDQISSTPLHYIDSPLRNSILNDISEFVVSAQSKLYKSVALLAGSITESVLLGVATLNPDLSKNHLQSSKDSKISKKIFPDTCGIIELAHICRSAGIITDSDLSTEVLRGYRDHIHPNRHTKSQTDLDDHTVSTILGTLGKLLKDLTDSEQKGLMQQYKEKRLGV